MSLTGHIKNKRGPVSQFLRSTFPNTRRFLEDFRKQVRQVGTIRPDIDISWGTIGTAVDYRVRYYFDVTPSDHLVAHKGALRLSKRENWVPVSDGLSHVYTQDRIALFDDESSHIPRDEDEGLNSRFRRFFVDLDGLLRRRSPSPHVLRTLMKMRSTVTASFGRIRRNRQGWLSRGTSPGKCPVCGLPVSHRLGGASLDRRSQRTLVDLLRQVCRSSYPPLRAEPGVRRKQRCRWRGRRPDPRRNLVRDQNNY